MQDRHAELTLAFRSHVFDDPFNGLLAGTTDVALLSHHAGHPDIETMTVMAEDRVCLVPNGHVLAQRRFLTPADFLDLPAIVIDGADNMPAVKAWSDALALSEEIGSRPVGASVGTAQEWLLAAAGGKGFSTAPMSVTRYTAHPGVSAVPVIDVTPLLVSVGWVRGRKSCLVQEFVDVVARLARDSRGDTTL
ncbi:LysR substrate-binding domain-containing protein [Rhodococcus sp. IEGM 1381]|uniref:LysR substrate-binding domain-containing protein n=1 Tax=Rhodococcus sp. IEGM 1381 TaxID=3047085 RepID=UPI0024B842EA|nr:LysR substrate-binding domain-containing protein [Rhodococcus sp. IEGM 1381]MDI9897429.1 LysR substrate-binding domain-containing protein [Rhodococcus sp. IEGM 1381]